VSFRPGRVLWTASAAQASVSFVIFGLPAIGPELRERYGLSLAALGAVLTATVLGSGLAVIAFAAAVERFGPRPCVAAGSALGAAGLLLAAFASSAPALAAGLLVSGVGLAVVPLAGTRVLFELYDPGRRAWALGMRQTAGPVGGALAALAIPLLERLGGVRLPLLIAALAVGASGAAFVPVAGGGRRPAAVPFQLRRVLTAPGMLRLLASAVCFIVALQAVLTFTVTSVRAAGLSAFVAGATLFAVNATAIVSRPFWGMVADRDDGRRRVRTLVEVGILAAAGALIFALARHTGPWLVITGGALLGFGAFGWNAIVYVIAGEGASPRLASQAVSVALTVVMISSALCTAPLGAVADRFGWDAFWLATAAIALAGAALAAGLTSRFPRDFAARP
jgi:MFS family permease